MDYSENLAGASPWATSSPRQSRQDLTQSISSVQDESNVSTPAMLNSTTLSDSSTLSRGLPEDLQQGMPAQPNAAQDEYTSRSQTLSQPQGNLPYRSQKPTSQPFDATQPQPYDPRDYRQTHVASKTQQAHHDVQPGVQNSSAQAFKLHAKVNGLERSGRKDPVLRFDVWTNLPGYRTSQFRDVRRTHAEFSKLADHLVSANPEALVPAMPPASSSAGVGTDEDETRTKALVQRWLNVVCGNDILMRDEELIRFVEGDPGYSPVVKWSQPATGVRRKVLKQFAPPPDDTPELLASRPIVKQFYLASMDAGQKVDKMVKSRRSLGLSETDFGNKLGTMSENELHPGLRNAYRKLGKTIQTIGDLLAAQGTAQAATLADPLQYHSSDAFIVKETLTNRHILLRELIQAQQTTRSKLSAADRLRSSTSVRRDKVDEAIAALDEARSQESYLSHKTQRVTANLLQDTRKWFSRTAADLRASIREHVVREIEAERRALAILESVRPDVRAIDASGGLSRLGREAHPTGRRTALVSSQGPKGDAWSGVQRRANGLNRDISSSYIAPIVDESIHGEDQAGLTGGRQRATSGAGSLKSLQQEDDDDRVDAKNAASRLATSTF